MTPYVIQLSLLAAASALLVAAGSDLRRYLIPDTCSLILLASFALYALTGATQGAWPLHLAIFALVFLIGLGLFAAGLAGGGDVKLLAATALWAGPALLAGLVVIMSLAGGLLAVIVLTRIWWLRRLAPADLREHLGASIAQQPIPYGVAIASGGLFVLARYAGLLG
ncbi:A24 family peptidase [Algihabitans albus]|uniref:A24 family peptidase n=1 Tax=Algihabitans albus TaxID=2164067 RepID=UPI000E5D2307|nr:prepilin peptidase [Algihabitans albus]